MKIDAAVLRYSEPGASGAIRTNWQALVPAIGRFAAVAPASGARGAHRYSAAAATVNQLTLDLT